MKSSSKYSCLVSLCWFYCQPSVHASSSSSSSVWKGEFPIPPTPPHGVSDPDAVLSPSESKTLADRLLDLNVSVKLGGDSHPTSVPIQIVVALVERMMPTTTTMTSDSDGAAMDPDQDKEEQRIINHEEVMAERMARSFHDAWGVGQVTEWGGTGILIFVSKHDRVIYISRGGALDRILTSRRLDTILYRGGTTARQTNLANALMDMITDIIHYVELGEPTWTEKVSDLLRLESLLVLLWLGIFVYGTKLARLQEKRLRAYAQATSHLSEIDRAQAQALQGQYEVTSCPICLENFKSSTIGSDNQPLKLLRCGHGFDESCWSEWVTTGQGNVTKCPICKMDIGRSFNDEPNNNHSVRLAFTEGTIQNPWENDTDTDTDTDADYQTLVLRRFQQERNFRLIRLGMRYPDFVSQSQIQQWSSPTYQGSLARDPSFQQRAPQQGPRDGMARTTSTDDSYRPMSFGGGTSSGGRAGRF